VGSYISVTLLCTQTMPEVLVQQAVEEIDVIPEFNISQSLAARFIVRREHRMNTIYPVLRFVGGRAP
jgi:hypothetical protein